MKVEATITAGMPAFEVIGLPELAVREARVRVRSAIRMAGLDFPRTRVVVEVTDPFASTANDLPIALAVLKTPLPADCIVMGELSLQGDIRPCVDVMRQVQGAPMCIVPWDNYWEARAVCDHVYAARSLRSAVDCLAGLALWPEPPTLPAPPTYPPPLCMSDVRGHSVAKRAMEVAAVGGHHVALVGSPGCGKIMLGRRLPTIMAPMTKEEAIETSMIHSEAGLLPLRGGLLTERPFRAPHHTCSSSALIGGGTIPRPGEVSLAHNGVLCLDEFHEFPRMVTESLREPLEQGTATVTRARVERKFHAKGQAVLLMNACPCGSAYSATKECKCSEQTLERFWRRLNGKVVDSVEIWVGPMANPNVDPSQLRYAAQGDTSATIQARVVAARANLARLVAAGMPVEDAAVVPWAEHVAKLGLTDTAVAQALAVAASIAALDNYGKGFDVIKIHHLAEALQYRRPDFTIVNS